MLAFWLKAATGMGKLKVSSEQEQHVYSKIDHWSEIVKYNGEEKWLSILWVNSRQTFLFIILFIINYWFAFTSKAVLITYSVNVVISAITIEICEFAFVEGEWHSPLHRSVL